MMFKTINVGRKSSGGVMSGMFGNPVREKKVSEQYRQHFRDLWHTRPSYVKWLAYQINQGAKLFCPGCKEGSPSCHIRIIEQELRTLKLIP